MKKEEILNASRKEHQNKDLASIIRNSDGGVFRYCTGSKGIERV